MRRMGLYSVSMPFKDGEWSYIINGFTVFVKMGNVSLRLIAMQLCLKVECSTTDGEFGFSCHYADKGLKC